ncbi:DUF1482 family protein [Klebsiella oxytoca]|uniref:DUF1482 family protein n=1 Tax=Klebsiella oxytoca TaxID=571 RepID=UPI0025972E85|nr:DUF1482 family protein [Klebsiella oxytoca]MDM4499730.1 DUF1482 family protein [Klebsiella oxytoca]MDS7732615.1 DUF1482 family protein [Klebsiella oxytoca]
MSTLYVLIISVCALTGECSDVLTGIYESEQQCVDSAAEQHVKGQCLPYKQAFAWADDQRPAVRF